MIKIKDGITHEQATKIGAFRQKNRLLCTMEHSLAVILGAQLARLDFAAIFTWPGASCCAIPTELTRPE